MKKLFVIITISLVSFVANAQNTFNLGKMVVDTTIIADEKYIAIVYDISNTIEKFNKLAESEQKQTSFVKNSEASTKLIQDLTALVNKYYNDFVVVDIKSQYIDTIAVADRLRNVYGEFIRIKNCTTCDSVYISRQLHILESEAVKLNRWLTQ